ncbi:hypothetical protein [Achromobacter dolens]|uniref:hypothetical protein n=1 Tax=Achromobacter dolens TaxID=1287738 RepID=UPI000E30E274|nr:hypothetical protein [Achromobacter dolens]
MSEHKIQPSTITKPIQLLAAWFVGLLTIDGSFLIAAVNMGVERWPAVALVAAAIFNVPMFLAALFLLQTKFRPELQEDSYYSTYISLKTNQSISVPRDEQLLSAIQIRIERIESAIQKVGEIAPDSDSNPPLHRLKFGLNKNYLSNRSITKLLDTHQIHYTTFGTGEVPRQMTVAISDHLDAEATTAVLTLAKQMGFELFDRFDAVVQDFEEDVLLGSYGTPGRPIQLPLGAD